MRSSAFVLVCFLLGAALQTSGHDAPTRRALLIGVSGYDQPRADNPKAVLWPGLETDPDVIALRSVLIQRYSFDPTHIRVLITPAQTTRDSILAAFRALIKQTRPSDTVYIHYSGHGYQASDKDPRKKGNPIIGDEADGLDETLIPSDYASQGDPSRDIRDDTIGELLDELKAKRPAAIVVTFDSCHSGTISRGATGVRSAPAPAGGTTRGPSRPDGYGFPTPEAGNPGYVLMTACRSDQEAIEWKDPTTKKDMGLFSYALVKALWLSRPGETFRSLHDRVAAYMQPHNERNQQPHFEGNLDQEVLGVRVSEPPRYYVVDASASDREPMLMAGSLVGIGPGTKLKLYPAGTVNFAGTNPLGEAVVRRVRVFESDLETTPADLSRNALHQARAVVSLWAGYEQPLRVDLSAIGNASAFEAIRERLRPLEADKTIQVATAPTRGGWDVRIQARTRGAQSGFEVLNAAGESIPHKAGSTYQTTVPDGPQAPEAIRDIVQWAARRERLASVTNPDPHSPIQVSARLVPVQVRHDAGGNPVKGPDGQWLIEAQTPLSGDTDPEIREGDYVAIEVRNDSAVPVYVGALDIQPDGEVRVMWPDDPSRRTAATEPGTTSLLTIPGKRQPSVWRIGPPHGREQVKVLATDKPLDLYLLVSSPQSRGTRGGAPPPLGRRLGCALDGTRGAENTYEPSAWWAADIYFRIVPR